MFDEEGYRKLALHVMASAVKDYARLSQQTPRHEGRPSAQVYDSKTYHTAQDFLSNIQNERLSLWCAWLRVDPKRVCRIYSATFAVGRRPHPSKNEQDT